MYTYIIGSIFYQLEPKITKNNQKIEQNNQKSPTIKKLATSFYINCHWHRILIFSNQSFEQFLKEIQLYTVVKVWSNAMALIPRGLPLQ